MITIANKQSLLLLYSGETRVAYCYSTNYDIAETSHLQAKPTNWDQTVALRQP